MVGVFGVQGWIKVQSYTRPGSNILKYRQWRIGDSLRDIEEGRPHGPGFVAKIRGLDDRDEAMRLAGQEISVLRSELPKPKKGEIYWSDLMGFSVVSEQGKDLGVLKALTDNGAQDVMVVGEEGRLIPYVVGPIVKALDKKGRKIVVAWDPEW